MNIFQLSRKSKSYFSLYTGKQKYLKVIYNLSSYKTRYHFEGYKVFGKKCWRHKPIKDAIWAPQDAGDQLGGNINDTCKVGTLVCVAGRQPPAASPPG